MYKSLKMRDIFYSLNHLNLKRKEELFRESQEASFSSECYIDEKDENYRRIRSLTSFEEMMQKMNETCHYFFIERNLVYGDEKPYLEMGFCTMGEEAPGDWFLFINLEMSHSSHFKEKYNLTIL